ncbi:MAG: type II toxin-antitoxin system HicA family toxin [Chloroflexota bacterium]|nr:type II toxin-antitoxin system HicA family toxin [Chloroflexota bacterium]MDE2958862.1 type II toxin-antitoxin system HicA family toxin [Chloroflexota bacterium]
MRPRSRLLQRILSGQSDANIRFNDLLVLLRRMGFDERISGSHHVFRRADVPSRINLQRYGSQAKDYQVRQVRGIILQYGLHESEDDG